MPRFVLVLLALLGAAYVHSQCVVRPTNIWLLVDEAESARQLSTTGAQFGQDFDLLRSALDSFVQNANLANTVQVGLISYGGSGQTTARVSVGLTSSTSLRSSNVIVQNIPDRALTLANGGSWTADALELLQFQVRESSTVNWVIVISALSGVNNPSRISRAVQAARTLKSQGYLVYVVHISPGTPMDDTELMGVANDGMKEVINSYRSLQATLAKFVESNLCVRSGDSNPCSSFVLGSGVTILPAPDTCAQFLQCLPNLSFQRKDCPPGTLFNDEYRTCGYLSSFSCPAWGQCRANQDQSYPALCCSQFYRCSNGNVALQNCPVGTVWRDNSRGCTPIMSSDNNCGASVQCPVTTTSVSDSCETMGFLSEPGNICSYRRRIAPLVFLSQQCAPGSAWNQTLCTCTSHPDCVPQTTPKISGPTCTAQFHINFNGGVRAISDVINAALPIWVDSKVTPTTSNTAVIFSGQSGWDRNLVYIPFYSSREFPDSVAFQVTFKLTNPTNGVPYDLLVNDYLGQCKKPSVYMTAVSNAGQITVNFRITTKTDQQVTVSATASNTNQPDAWIRATGVVQKLTVTGSIDVINSNGVTLSPTQKMNTANINSGIKLADCGLAIGQGTGNVLMGEVEDMKVFECDNPLSLLP